MVFCMALLPPPRPAVRSINNELWSSSFHIWDKRSRFHVYSFKIGNNLWEYTLEHHDHKFYKVSKLNGVIKDIMPCDASLFSPQQLERSRSLPGGL
jgi:hypothetical protein